MLALHVLLKSITLIKIKNRAPSNIDGNFVEISYEELPITNKMNSVADKNKENLIDSNLCLTNPISPTKLATDTYECGRSGKKQEFPNCSPPRSGCSAVSSPGSFFSPNASILSSGSTAKELARAAKLQHTAERRKKVEQLKEKWRIEKEQRLQLNKEKREMEREQLQQQHMKASQERKLLIQQKKDHEANEKARLRDLLTTSLQDKHVMQASKLEMDRERRRQSVLLNEKIREAGRKQIAHEREQHKQKQRLEIELRRIDFLEVKQKKKLEELRRRESLQFHTEQAKMQSLKGKNEIAVRAEEEEKNLREQRRENRRDEQAFKQEQKRRARESIAFQLQCWRQEKKNSEQRHQLHAEQEKFDLLLRSEDHKALQEHKLKEKKSERESLAGRLQ